MSNQLNYEDSQEGLIGGEDCLRRVLMVDCGDTNFINVIRMIQGKKLIQSSKENSQDKPAPAKPVYNEHYNKFITGQL